MARKNNRIYPSELFSYRGRNYLFGFAPSEKTSKGAYSQYLLFMKTITGILGEFGIHMSNNGYAFIIDAVMVITDMRSLDIRLNSDVYPYIAYKYEYKRYSSIEHNIRNAIRSAYRDNERHPGTNKMGIFERVPTNKQFLFYVTECVWRSMQDEILPAAC